MVLCIQAITPWARTWDPFFQYLSSSSGYSFHLSHSPAFFKKTSILWFAGKGRLVKEDWGKVTLKFRLRFYSGGGFSLSGQCCCYLFLENVIRNNVLAGFSLTPGQFKVSTDESSWCSWRELRFLTSFLSNVPVPFTDFRDAGVSQVLLYSGLGQPDWENQNQTLIEWECFWWNNSQNFQLAIFLDWWITHLQWNFRKGQNP